MRYLLIGNSDIIKHNNESFRVYDTHLLEYRDIVTAVCAGAIVNNNITDVEVVADIYNHDNVKVDLLLDNGGEFSFNIQFADDYLLDKRFISTVDNYYPENMFRFDDPANPKKIENIAVDRLAEDVINAIPYRNIFEDTWDYSGVSNSSDILSIAFDTAWREYQATGVGYLRVYENTYYNPALLEVLREVYPNEQLILGKKNREDIQVDCGIKYNMKYGAYVNEDGTYVAYCNPNNCLLIRGISTTTYPQAISNFTPDELNAINFVPISREVMSTNEVYYDESDYIFYEIPHPKIVLQAKYCLQSILKDKRLVNLAVAFDGDNFILGIRTNTQEVFRFSNDTFTPSYSSINGFDVSYFNVVSNNCSNDRWFKFSEFNSLPTYNSDFGFDVSSFTDYTICRDPIELFSFSRYTGIPTYDSSRGFDEGIMYGVYNYFRLSPNVNSSVYGVSYGFDNGDFYYNQGVSCAEGIFPAIHFNYNEFIRTNSDFVNYSSYDYVSGFTQYQYNLNNTTPFDPCAVFTFSNLVNSSTYNSPYGFDTASFDVPFRYTLSTLFEDNTPPSIYGIDYRRFS